MFGARGVDEVLERSCVGSRLRLKWDSSPPLRDPLTLRIPAGSKLVMDLELQTIQYKLFGEKMRSSSSKQEPIDYYFTPFPLTLTSPVDARGHKSDRVPLVKTDNPFALAPNTASFISNPANTLTPLWNGLRTQLGF